MNNAEAELGTKSEFWERVNQLPAISEMFPDATLTDVAFEKISKKVNDILLEPRAKAIVQQAYEGHFKAADLNQTQLWHVAMSMNKRSWLKSYNVSRTTAVVRRGKRRQSSG